MCIYDVIAKTYDVVGLYAISYVDPLYSIAYDIVYDMLLLVAWSGGLFRHKKGMANKTSADSTSLFQDA